MLAAVEGAGVYRKVGTGSFSKVSAGSAMASPLGEFPHATIDWPWGSPIAFLADPETGAWRSTDCGQSWRQVSNRKSSHPYGGYLAYDATGDLLYVSVANQGDTGNGVFRIAGGVHLRARRAATAATAPSRPPRRARAPSRSTPTATCGWQGCRPRRSRRPSSTGIAPPRSGWIAPTPSIAASRSCRSGSPPAAAEDGGQYVYVGFKGNAFIRGRK